MWFELDTTTLITLCAAISVVLFAEAVYLLGFSTASYRSRVNRRLKLSKNQPDREAILIQLRRERGLTNEGLLRFGVQWFNRLMLESGMTRGALTLVLVALVAGGAAFFGAMKFRDDMLEAGAASLAAALVLPFFVLLFMRKRRHGKFAAQFPDAMDIIVRSLRAGHPVPVAVGLVAQEMPIRSAPNSASRPMRSLTAPTSRPRCAIFISASARRSAAVRHGGGDPGLDRRNLSEILSNLSSVIRQRFKMRRKIRALAAEGKFSALFLSGLPVAVFGLINVMTPDFYGSILQYDLTKWVSVSPPPGCWRATSSCTRCATSGSDMDALFEFLKADFRRRQHVMM
jgi:tight adherence protein B